MRSRRFEQESFLALVFHDLEHDPQVVSSRTCPRLRQLSFQLMDPEGGMKGILCEKLQYCLQIRGSLRVPLRQALGRPDERFAGKQCAFHALIIFMMAEGLAALVFPAANSVRASFNAPISSARRFSATRRRSVAESSSCSSRVSRSAKSKVLAKVSISRHSPALLFVSRLYFVCFVFFVARVLPCPHPVVAGDPQSPCHFSGAGLVFAVPRKIRQLISDLEKENRHLSPLGRMVGGRPDLHRTLPGFVRWRMPW
jgi:hypothetical protein